MKRQCETVHAVEKIRPRAEFNGEREDRRDPQSWICIPYQRPAACQSGTVDDGSYWDGPRLRSEFAAQVIGQALPAGDTKASAAAAYRRSQLVLLPLFDENV
jgi:hypothetical protein